MRSRTFEKKIRRGDRECGCNAIYLSIQESDVLDDFFDFTCCVAFELAMAMASFCSLALLP